MLKLVGVKKGFPLPRGMRREVLDIEKFAFPDQGLFAICGPSGEGKTTLLNLLALLDVPDEGKIYFNDQEVTRLQGKQENAYRHIHVGYMRQFSDLLPYLNSMRNVTVSYAISSPFSKKADEIAYAESLLERFGVGERKHDYPATLSGGEKARVALCRALAMNPEILLCDEPTGSLGAAEAKEVMGYLKSVSKEKLVLVVSHDERLMEEYCDACVRLDQGRLIGDISQESKADVSKPSKMHLRPLAGFSLALRHISRSMGKFLLAGLIGAFGVLGTAISLSIRSGTGEIASSLSSDVKARMPLSVSTFSIGDGLDLFGATRSSLLPSDPYVVPQSMVSSGIHTNLITPTFLEHLAANLPADGYSLHYDAVSSVMQKMADDTYQVFNAGNGSYGGLDLSFLESFLGEAPLLKPCEYSTAVLATHNDLLYGSFPEKEGDMFLFLEQDNTLDERVVALLGLEGEKVPFTSFIGRSFKFIPNDVLYKKRTISSNVTGRFLKTLAEFKAEEKSIPGMISEFLDAATYYENGDLEKAQECMARFDDHFGPEETRELFAYSPIAKQDLLKQMYEDPEVGHEARIVGILRRKATSFVNIMTPGLYFPSAMAEKIRLENASSAIAEEAHSHLVLANTSTTLHFPDIYSIYNSVKKADISDVGAFAQALLTYYQSRAQLGLPDGPSRISFPLTQGQERDKVLAVLDSYNQDKTENKQIKVFDYGDALAKMIDGYGGVFQRSATFIFLIVAFSNLLVMLLFSTIQTRGRSREVGLYRYLGMGKGKLLSLFISEGIYQGLFSGIVGLGLGAIFIAWFNNFTLKTSSALAITNVAILSPINALIIVAVSLLTGLLASLVVAMFYATLRPSTVIIEEP